MNAQSLLDALTADTASHISFLQSFVQAPSPNPPGDTREAADMIRNYLASHGIATQIIAPQAHMPNIVCDFTCSSANASASAPAGGEAQADAKGKGWEGPGPRLILNGHIDVFPAGDGHDWDRGSPWSGDIVDGRLYGRGAVDMKAGTAASVIAFAYLYRYREHLLGAGSVGLCAVSDEETGGKFGTRWLLHDHDYDHDHGHDSESGAEEGEGSSKAPGEKSRWAGDVMINAEPGGVNTIRFAEKGTLRLTFTVDVGPGAHGAFTHLSKSATRIAARLIGDLAVVEDVVPDLDPKLKEYLERHDVREAIDKCSK